METHDPKLRFAKAGEKNNFLKLNIAHQRKTLRRTEEVFLSVLKYESETEIVLCSFISAAYPVKVR